MEIAERLRSKYVLTSDNFIKMLLIYMRIQSGIPVLIMGETGKGIFFIDILVYHAKIFFSRMWQDDIDSILMSKDFRR
jgi:hypothetical protein